MRNLLLLGKVDKVDVVVEAVVLVTSDPEALDVDDIWVTWADMLVVVAATMVREDDGVVEAEAYCGDDPGCVS